MSFVRAAAAALFVALTLTGAATAGKASQCVVVPNPVTLGVDTEYTVTATGGVPLETYEVTLRQKHHLITDEARVWLGQADDTGTVTATIGVSDGRIYGMVTGALWPGEPTLNVVRYRTGGGPGGAASKLATCSFVVV
jgi:hypothetical protein